MRLLLLNTLCLLILTMAAVAGETNDLVSDGATLYARHCANCHGENGEGRRQGNATSLNNQDFLTTASDDFLIAAITKGRPETAMPPFGKELKGGLSSKEISRILAFLRNWQKEPLRKMSNRVIGGSPLKGKTLYVEYCANCHGRQGKGELGMGPALSNQAFLEAATDGFLWETIARGRRDTPMFPSLKGLGGVRQLSKQEIGDLIAFIRTWEK